VTAAGEAHARGDWRATYDALAPDRDVLDLTDLARLADAAWWLGETPDSMALSEDLFQRLVGDGADTEAAERALRLSLQWFARGDLPIAFAWLARARRLLEPLPRCALHGYLAYLEASVDLEVTEDPGPAASAASTVRTYAEEFADPALDSFAHALGGLAAVRRGRTAAGFARLDEAMLPVLAGRVDPLWSGDLYCTVIHLCDALADLTRMRAWTEALGRWSRSRSATFMFAGVTRIHELQLVAAEGDWDTVERELGDASADLVDAHGWLAGEGYYGLGEVRRLRGDPAGARAAYARAEELARDPQPGRALLLRAEGRPRDALAQLRVSLAEHSPLGRAGLLPAAVDLALETGDPSYAETLASELEETATRFGTAGLRARAAQTRAALLLAVDDPTAAIPLLEEAAQVYRDQRHRHASAQVHERLAAAHRALDDTARAAAEEATAMAIYARLGAAPDLARLDRHPRPGGLTDREVEVLRLVSTGSSNQQVADTLTISGKTVSRHLANIFVKIGVSTRTAAAAWARDHGL
jgi:DNA-binding NarL/FixJ family response regulator